MPSLCLGGIEREAALSPGRIYEFHLQAKEADKAWWLPEITLYVHLGAEGPILAGLERR